MNLFARWQDHLIYPFFLVLFAVFAITLGPLGFLSGDNLMNIVRQSATIAVMAVSLTFVLAAGEIDLSFGAVIALGGVVAALVLGATGNAALAALAGVSAGALVGLVNGAIVGAAGVPSFLVTLGTGAVVLGLSRWFTGQQSIPVDDPVFTFVFGSGNLGPVPILLLWTLAAGALGAFVLKRTLYGRHVLATGGNKISALYSGIRVGWVKLSVLVANGAVAGLVGLLYAGRLQGARATAGENDLMMVLTAVIIGGTSLFGGKGSVAGAVTGALVMGMVNNGLILMGLSVDQQMVLRGLVIVAAVTLTMGQRKKT